jgi:uncharacterized protein YjbI with pentapeptide repeats
VTFVITREINSKMVTLRADLAGANLTGANFQAAALSSADLHGTNLSNANFKLADLRQANLNQANLMSAFLGGANLASADLTEADLTNANLSGTNLAGAILSGSVFSNTVFVTIDPVSFPVELTAAEFLEFLLSEDCGNGTFLLVSDGTITPADSGFTRDLGIRFYRSGRWRTARSYLCIANMSSTTWRGRLNPTVYLAGVKLNGADLQYSDFSSVTFEDFIKVDDLDYKLSADLTETLYNEFTLWPTNYIPPASAIPVPVESP